MPQDFGECQSDLFTRSPSTSSIRDASATIDELTFALSNFSRVSSPELPVSLSCCCGKDDCSNMKTWTERKSRLESRLILSAEVGHALLQKHEAYVRSHDRCQHASAGCDGNTPEDGDDIPRPDIVELLREKRLLEKRLNQVLADNEATEASNKVILSELQGARSAISRLTIQHARSAGWETRLATLTQEKEDLQQERDGEANRAKLAESRLVVMKDKTARLQSEVRRLQDALAERRSHQLESSEHVVRDARTRLEALYDTTTLEEREQLMNVLESLVNTNEMLKRDNSELQVILSDSREEIRAMQEEVEEARARTPSRSRAGTPLLKQRLCTGSVPSSIARDSPIYRNSRSVSAERRFHRSFEPLTPETGLRPLSPADLSLPLGANFTPQSHSSSQISIDIDDTFVDRDGNALSPDRPISRRPLLLLSRSRGVQTDPWLGTSLAPPFQLPFVPPSLQDQRSETSSFSEISSSNLSSLLERISALFHRMAQADALTLTNRLKRQHLKGADVSHLSRTTVRNIVLELTHLHTQYRHLLEDDNLISPCGRKDFKFLFKLVKEMFNELGELRIVLNDVILDPSVAHKVSELALNSNKLEDGAQHKEHESPANSSVAASWMGPLSKFFTPNTQPAERVQRSSSNRIPRFVPKLEPALGASTIAVNVEFSGTVVGKSMTSTIAQTKQKSLEAAKTPASSNGQNASSAVMHIFAGAPANSLPDPWVIIPKVPRRVQSFVRSDTAYGTTPRRSTNTSGVEPDTSFSREIDAVLDLPSPARRETNLDILGHLPERPLHRRGLSDSSIHTTFNNQANEDLHPQIAVNLPSMTDQIHVSRWPRPHSVLQTVSRTVQNLRMTASGTLSSIGPSDPTSNTNVQTPPLETEERQADKNENKRGKSPVGLRNYIPIPTLSSWPTAGTVLDPRAGDGFVVGSVRDEPFLPRTRRSDARGHDFF